MGMRSGLTAEPHELVGTVPFVNEVIRIFVDISGLFLDIRISIRSLIFSFRHLEALLILILFLIRKDSSIGPP
jgi:hypothetical protein